MSYAMEPINSDSDVSDSEEMVEQRTRTPKRIGLVVLGLACLVVCAIVGAFAFSQHYDKNGITARALLESQGMITALTQNQIDILNLQDDKTTVRTKVVKAVKRLEDEIEAKDKARWRELNDLNLEPHQRDALIRIVSSTTDPRVQEIGRKVSKAFVDGQSAGREGVKSRLNQIFNEEELPKLRQLKNELFHGLHRPAPQDSKVTFNADSMRLLKSLPGNSGSGHRRLDGFDDSLVRASDESDTLDFDGALGEQTRTLLDQIDQMGQRLRHSQIPAEAKVGAGAMDFITNVHGCLQRATGNNVKKSMCVPRYARAALDSMSAIDDELGINNDNSGVNHNGKDSV